MSTATETAVVRAVCPHCHKTNRVPAERLADAPVCGGCKQPLLEPRPFALTEANIDKHIENSDLPLVIDFWAPWCGPCKSMTPVYERTAAELETRARLAKVNTDEQPGLAARFGIRGIPTFVIFRDGREVARTSGAMDLGRFLNWVRSECV
ncbi:MAG: thioredoxin TrxC [Betaproteobacteria bacterium]|nr:thioredoxin TrxC [Betaproteobacteria bacterium]